VDAFSRRKLVAHPLHLNAKSFVDRSSWNSATNRDLPRKQQVFFSETKQKKRKLRRKRFKLFGF
jgi:hypothetical protein